MLQGEHSAILPIFIRLPFVIMIFVLSIFEWPFYTGFTVQAFTKLTEISDLMSFHHKLFWSILTTFLTPLSSMPLMCENVVQNDNCRQKENQSKYSFFYFQLLVE